MEEVEPPECPVCLVPYDAISTVPRVLSCGHSTCESCISQLPNPFPHTIRCPSCTQLLKLPINISLLPKNIDLLRFSSSIQGVSTGSRNRQPQNSLIDVPFIPNSWSPQFYSEWRSWLLPKDSVLLESNSMEDGSFLCFTRGKLLKGTQYSYFRSILRDDAKVWLLRIGEEENELGGLRGNTSTCKFTYNYESKTMKVLFLMEEIQRNEVSLLLNASLRLSRVGSIFGIWCNEEDNIVYVVFEKFTSCLMKEELVDGVLGEISGEGEKVGVMGGFGMVGVELCDVINDLHVEGLVIGCFRLKSFSFNQLGHISVNFADVLLMGRRFCKITSEMDDWEDMVVDAAGMEDCIFLSPEVAATLLKRNIPQTGDTSSLREVGYGSDVWSLACLLIFILVGNSFVTCMRDYYHDIFTALVHQKDVDYVKLYTDWVDKVINMLEGQLASEFFSLKKTLLECLSFNSESRPVLTALWNCLKELIIKPEFDLGSHPKREMLTEIPNKCIVLGSLCSLVSKNELDKLNTTADDLPEKQETALVEVDRVEGLKAEDAIIEAFSKGNFKCIELKAHVDCVTGLAVGGGFLFSSSHDKSVKVWSLQDFSLVHTFKGHEDRVTALLFIEGEEPLCVSADKGGVICIWAARNPLDSSPMKKLSEPKDWRYSGIHALAFSGTHYLYTGSGDKTIKVWSLQDYALINTMNGHKSVVCALAVSNGVLYSGSWDGTVRLWSLSDHNPLAVLGEDVPGNPSSVLSIAADDNMLIVAHEDGSIKTWYESRLLKSRSVHIGAVFSVCKMGSWLFTGGWDKTVNVQDMSSGSGVEEVDGVLSGSISTDSVVTSLAYFEGKLFVGLANRLVKVYYCGV